MVGALVRWAEVRKYKMSMHFYFLFSLGVHLFPPARIYGAYSSLAPHTLTYSARALKFTL